jgi:hypothetical protein
MLLAGCVRRIPAWLPRSNPDYPLTIDVHCHFFNGSDLQMAGFISETVNQEGKPWAGPAAASLAQDINWGIAPTAKSEKKELETTERSSQKTREKWRKAHAAQSNKFRQELQKPNAQATLHSNRLAEPQKLSKNAEPRLEGGLTEALEEYAQYRYVAFFDYLNLYNNDPSTNRTIDLAVAHLVDYDWPLRGGEQTKSPLNEQVELMKKISIVSHGRVHTFAPFCPLREVAYRANFQVKNGANWSSLEMVQNWVKESGCIGVKIYPPMGFAPYGNAQIPPDFWDGHWKWLPKPDAVPGAGGTATMGERLDQVLGDLYDWCLKEDVPVMAHTDLSNGLSTKFNGLTESKYWGALSSSRFGRLRLDFGHLGGFEDTSVTDWSMGSDASAGDVNARDLVALMSADSTTAGGRFYGDSAYTESVLNDSDRLRLQKVLDKALAWKTPGQPQPILADRLMYGSDWSLLMKEIEMRAYFEDFVRMYSALDPTGKVSAKFFGENAVEYLGLRDGRTRQRLLDFYKDNGVHFDRDGQPAWMRKIR